jgi:ribosomal-protein-alanine N-acetyltransferase
VSPIPTTPERLPCRPDDRGLASSEVPTRLQTARLVIRRFEERDSDDWFTMVSEPEFHRYLPTGPHPTTASFRAMLERYHELERAQRIAVCAVELGESEAFIGQCGLQPVERAGPEIEIAYHFKRACWSQGYATEAATAVLGHAFGPLELDRVIALVVPENVGSWRVAEKSGMRYERLAAYYGMTGLKQYSAGRTDWMRPTGC